jgi:hypothetical protein
VKVGVQLQVGAHPLHDDHGAALAVARPLLRQPRLVEPEHGAHRDPRHRSEQLPVVGKALPPRERHGEHPLPQGARGQHAVHEVRGRGRHASTHARRAESPTLTGKAHEPVLVATGAFEVRKTSTEQPAIQVTRELLADEPGKRDRDRAVIDGPVERLEVVAHDRVQRRGLGSSALVDEGCPGAGGGGPGDHSP